MPTIKEIKDPNFKYCNITERHCLCPKCELTNICDIKTDSCANFKQKQIYLKNMNATGRNGGNVVGCNKDYRKKQLRKLGKLN